MITKRPDGYKSLEYTDANFEADVKIMLSNSNTPFIEDLYKYMYFRKHIVHAPRFVNCKPDQRGKITELLITNYGAR